MLSRIANWLGYEKRLSPRHPDDWQFMFNGATTSSGVMLNDGEALGLPAFFAGVNQIANDVARTPLKLYRKRDDGGSEVVDGHELNYLFSIASNPMQTAFQFKLQAQAQVCVYGNSYSRIVRDEDDGRVVMLDLFRPGQCKYDEAEEVYVVTLGDGRRQLLLASDVLHVRGLGLHGFAGVETWEVGRDAIALGLAGMQYQSYSFSNGARPALVIEHPTKMDPLAKDAFLKMWQAQFGSVKRSHKTAILENGMTARTLSHTAQEAEVNETRRQGNKDAANYLGVPPHKVGDEANRSYASLEQENMSYLTESLDRHFCNWEAELNKQLVATEEQGDLFFKFSRNALLQADINTRFSAYSSAVASGWMTPNEVRAFEDMPSIDGGDQLVNAQGIKLTDEGTGNDTDGTSVPDGAAGD